QDHADLVRGPVVAQGHDAACRRLPVHGDRPDAPAGARRVVHPDVVRGRTESVGDLIPGPAGRDARLDAERIAPDADADDRLDGPAVQPAGRARVPGPAAAAGMRRGAIDVGTDDVRLDLVLRDLGRRASVVDRVDQVPQLDGPVAAALQGRREHDPGDAV